MTVRTTTKTASSATAAKNLNAQAKAIGHDKPVAEETATGFEGVYQRFTEAQESLLQFFKVPSWKRTLVAFITTVAAGCGIGWISGNLLSWLVAGATLMAVPTFIVFCVYALGALATMYFGTKLCVRIGGAVLTGEADERAAAAYDAVKGALKRLNPFVKMQPVQG